MNTKMNKETKSMAMYVFDQYDCCSANDPDWYEFAPEDVRQFALDNFNEDPETGKDYGLELNECTKYLIDWSAVSEYIKDRIPNPYECYECCMAFEDELKEIKLGNETIYKCEDCCDSDDEDE